MSYYATLAQARAQLGADSTIDDAELLQHVRVASARIDILLAQRRPLFLPWRETRRFAVEPRRVNTRYNTLALEQPLLALHGVTAGDTTLTVGVDVITYPEGDTAPHCTLQLLGYRSWYSFYASAEPYAPVLVQVDATWGLHRDYDRAWLQVDAITTPGGIGASTTTFAVADVDGDNPLGEAPRLSAGNLIRIGGEYMIVLATNTTTNVVTVRRGVHGTTAAAHVQNAPVYVFDVEPPIVRAAARQAALLYARRGAFVTVQLEGATEVRYPRDLLDELRAAVGEYQYGSC